MMQPLYPGADGMTYENVPTCDSVTVPRWYASVMFSLDTQTRPWTGSASQTTCRMQGKDLPNYSNSGAASLLVVLLTMSVSEFGCANRLRIRHG